VHEAVHETNDQNEDEDEDEAYAPMAFFNSPAMFPASASIIFCSGPSTSTRTFGSVPL